MRLEKRGCFLFIAKHSKLRFFLLHHCQRSVFFVGGPTGGRVPSKRSGRRLGTMVKRKRLVRAVPWLQRLQRPWRAIASVVRGVHSLSPPPWRPVVFVAFVAPRGGQSVSQLLTKHCFAAAASRGFRGFCIWFPLRPGRQWLETLAGRFLNALEFRLGLD